jgi:hypothetical protein
MPESIIILFFLINFDNFFFFFIIKEFNIVNELHLVLEFIFINIKPFDLCFRFF